MARIEPDMLCLVKNGGVVKGMVQTIRRAVADDFLPVGAQAPWLCKTLSTIAARGLLESPLGAMDLGPMDAPPDTEGWCSECYLYPLPGVDDDVDTSTELPNVKEKEHDLIS